MTDNQTKSLQKITNILNDFLAPFDCNAEAGSDFAYYMASNMITYSFTVSYEHEETFMHFTHELFPDINADIFLWSFLHELGHHETENDFEDEEWDEYLNICNIIEDDYEYYHLPIEYAATYWAGKYITNHESEIKALWDQLVPAFQNFYKEMEVL